MSRGEAAPRRRAKASHPAPPIRFGLDIGGTLCKVAVFIRNDMHEESAVVHDVISTLVSSDVSHDFIKLADHLEIGNIGVVHFASFPSAHMATPKSPSQSYPDGRFGSVLSATGGGAHKYEKHILEKTSLDHIEHVGEIQALFDGLDFLLRNSANPANNDEIFVCTNVRFAGMVGSERQRLETAPLSPPLRIRSTKSAEGFLVVNIGSGVSFVDCDGRGSHVRVGGSSLGGATFHGLVNLLCQTRSFDEALHLASQGDSTKADLLVGDIYSDDKESNKKLEDLGLRSTTLAASFGKMANLPPENRASPADIALACLIMIALNVAAMAHLHALAKSRRVVLFVGSFLGGMTRRNNLAIRTLTYGIEFWGDIRGVPMRAAFLKREGYLGALGVLAKNEDILNPPTKSKKNAVTRSNL